MKPGVKPVSFCLIDFDRAAQPIHREAGGRYSSARENTRPPTLQGGSGPGSWRREDGSGLGWVWLICFFCFFSLYTVAPRILPGLVRRISWLVVRFSRFGSPWGRLGAPSGSLRVVWDPLGVPWASLGRPWGRSGSLRDPLGSFGVSWRSFGVSWGAWGSLGSSSVGRLFPGPKRSRCTTRPQTPLPDFRIEF